jgi:hypothetical protein
MLDMTVSRAAKCEKNTQFVKREKEILQKSSIL